MDKESEKVRLQFAEKADLLGAIRLPENAFRKMPEQMSYPIFYFPKTGSGGAAEASWVEVGENRRGI